MLQLEGVCKFFGAIRVIEGRNLKVDRGTSLCLLGPSGSGKSTLLKLMALIARPDKGSVVVDGISTVGMNQDDLDRLRAKKISYSFQEPLLIPYLNALENVVDVLGADVQKAKEIMSVLGLADRLNHPPSKLSGGEKKRVDLARAMLKESPIILADEPYSFIDPETADKIANAFNEFTDKSRTLVYTAVDPNHARFADMSLDLSK